jgi:hypothetical protein
VSDKVFESPEAAQAHRDLSRIWPTQTWTTGQLLEEFDVLEFSAPYVVVSRKSDGQLGSLEFTHSPRVYFGWQEHKP